MSESGVAQRRVRVLMTHLVDSSHHGGGGARLMKQWSCRDQHRRLNRHSGSVGGSADRNGDDTPSKLGGDDGSAVKDEGEEGELRNPFYWNVVALIILSQLSSLHKPMLQAHIADGNTQPSVQQIQRSFYNKSVHAVAQWIGYYYSMNSEFRRVTSSHKNRTIVGSALIPLGIAALSVWNHALDRREQSMHHGGTDARGALLRFVGNLLCSAGVGVGSGIAQRTAFSSIIMDQFPAESREQSFAISMFLMLGSVTSLWVHPLHSWLSSRLAKMGTKENKQHPGKISTGMLTLLIAFLAVPLLYRSLVSMSELYNEKVTMSITNRDGGIGMEARQIGRQSQETPEIDRVQKRSISERVASILDSLQYILVLLSMSFISTMTTNLSASILHSGKPPNEDEHGYRKESLLHGFGQSLPALYRLLGIGLVPQIGRSKRTPRTDHQTMEKERPSGISSILSKLVGPKVWRHAISSVDNLVGYTLLLQMLSLLGLSYYLHHSKNNSDDNDNATAEKDPSIAHGEQSTEDGIGHRMLMYISAMMLYATNAMFLPIMHRYHKARPGLVSPALQSASLCLGNVALPSLWNTILPTTRKRTSSAKDGEENQRRAYHRFMLYTMTLTEASAYLLSRLNYHFKRLSHVNK